LPAAAGIRVVAWHAWQSVACGQKTTGRKPVRTALMLAELSGWER